MGIVYLDESVGQRDGVPTLAWYARGQWSEAPLVELVPMNREKNTLPKKRALVQFRRYTGISTLSRSSSALSYRS
jgi:hypothetical protein